MSEEIRHLTEREQLEKYIENLKIYQEEIIEFTTKEIENTKEKLKVLRKDNK